MQCSMLDDPSAIFVERWHRRIHGCQRRARSLSCAPCPSRQLPAEIRSSGFAGHGHAEAHSLAVSAVSRFVPVYCRYFQVPARRCDPGPDLSQRISLGHAPFAPTLPPRTGTAPVGASKASQLRGCQTSHPDGAVVLLADSQRGPRCHSGPDAGLLRLPSVCPWRSVRLGVSDQRRRIQLGAR